MDAVSNTNACKIHAAFICKKIIKKEQDLQSAFGVLPYLMVNYGRLVRRGFGPGFQR